MLGVVVFTGAARGIQPPRQEHAFFAGSHHDAHHALSEHVAGLHNRAWRHIVRERDPAALLHHPHQGQAFVFLIAEIGHQMQPGPPTGDGGRVFAAGQVRHRLALMLAITGPARVELTAAIKRRHREIHGHDLLGRGEGRLDVDLQHGIVRRMPDGKAVGQDGVEPRDAHEPFAQASFLLRERQDPPVIWLCRADEQRCMPCRMQCLHLEVLRQQRHAFEPADQVGKQIAHHDSTNHVVGAFPRDTTKLWPNRRGPSSLAPPNRCTYFVSSWLYRDTKRRSWSPSKSSAFCGPPSIRIR
jgi:hypothetical protein